MTIRKSLLLGLGVVSAWTSVAGLVVGTFVGPHLLIGALAWAGLAALCFVTASWCKG